MAQDHEIIRDEIAKMQHPQLFRHPKLKQGQWRFDMEFGRKHNPHVFAQEHGYPQLTGRAKRRGK